MLYKNLPKMILFDYGQTIIAGENQDFVKDNQALLNLAIKNPNNITAKIANQRSNELLDEMCHHMHSASPFYRPIEVTWQSHNKCMFEYFGVEFSLPYDELQWIF